MANRIADAWNVLTGQASVSPALSPVVPDPAPTSPPAETQSLGRRDFGPLNPLTPRGDPPGHRADATPRQWQYGVGYNIVPTPRSDVGSVSFSQLRAMAAGYDVAASCISARIEQMQGLGWSIVPMDKRNKNEFADECAELERFFAYPDGVNDWSTWLSTTLYEALSIDAMTWFPRRTRGGDLYALEVIDGSTIKPLIDDQGRSTAYQQILYGYPFSDYRRPSADRPDERFPTYGHNELLYCPRNRRVFTPYGFPPIEYVFLTVRRALQKQQWDLEYFDSSSIPEMLLTAPPDGNLLNPQQMVEFEDGFNAKLAGDLAARRQAHFIPWSMNIHELRQFSYDPQYDEWLMRLTCGAFAVPRVILGFVDDVNRSSSEMQEEINRTRGLNPLAKWLTSKINQVITVYRPRRPDIISMPGLPTRAITNPFDHITWQFHIDEGGDRMQQAQIDQIYLAAGVLSEDEIRALRFGDEVDGRAPGRPAQAQAPSFAPAPSPFGVAKAETVTPKSVGELDESELRQGLEQYYAGLPGRVAEAINANPAT